MQRGDSGESAVSLADALVRWEQILSAQFPLLLERMLPGLDDSGIERLAEGLAP
jgi:hypothetical protein